MLLLELDLKAMRISVLDSLRAMTGDRSSISVIYVYQITDRRNGGDTFPSFQDKRDSGPALVFDPSDSRAERGAFGVARDIFFVFEGGELTVGRCGVLADDGLFVVDFGHHF